MSIRFRLWNSASRIDVIKKPDSTKKMSTPRNPPGIGPVSLMWKTTTAATASARTPSRPAA